MLMVSDTAFSIAAVRAEEGTRPPEERLFEDPYAASFLAAGAHAEAGTKRYLELPFFRDGIRLRTRFIDDVVQDWLAAGVDQLVLLGAGFDARAFRMPEIAAHHARVYEIDLADQLDAKRRLLAAAGVALPDWIAYVPSDFTAPDFEQALAHSLEARGFRRDRGSLFVWEGVTTYIGVAAVDRSLRFVAAFGGPGSGVVFDFGAHFFGQDSVAAHVVRAGFATCEDHGADELWRRYLRGEPHPAAWVFRMAVARLSPGAPR
jgi:methyltransferase (TIGR00027 family)